MTLNDLCSNLKDGVIVRVLDDSTGDALFNVENNSPILTQFGSLAVFNIGIAVKAGISWESETISVYAFITCCVLQREIKNWKRRRLKNE